MSLPDRAVSRIDDLIREGEALSDTKRDTTVSELENFKTESVDVLISLGQRFESIRGEAKSVEFELASPQNPMFGG